MISRPIALGLAIAAILVNIVSAVINALYHNATGFTANMIGVFCFTLWLYAVAGGSEPRQRG